VHYEDKQQTVTRNDVNQQGSSLSGGSVQVKAGGDLTLKGGEVKSTAGDTTLSGKNVSLLAEQDSHKTRPTPPAPAVVSTTPVASTAPRWCRFCHSTTQDSSGKTTAQTTSVQSSGGLNLNADKLVTEGAQVKAGNSLNVAANEIDNRAASNTESSSHNQSNWSADIGANVEYKDIARPIAGAVKDVLNGKVPDKEALSNLGQPNVGLDVAIGHGSADKTELQQRRGQPFRRRQCRGETPAPCTTRALSTARATARSTSARQTGCRCREQHSRQHR
jgi:hemolysin